MILILSCLSIIFPGSVAYDLKYGDNNSKNYPASLGDLPNINAIKLSGNELEVLAKVILLESSHHQHRSSICSFEGQSFKSFISNIVCNLLKEWGSRMPQVVIDFQIIDEYEYFNLKDFLSNHIVPYLYPANCKIPDILQKLTSENQISVGYCERTPDKDKVDIAFSLLSLNNSDIRNDCLALVECKNWFNEVSFTDIEEILSNSFQNPLCKINLIFCKHLIDPADPSTKQYYARKLESFCTRNKISVYSFKKTGPSSYKVNPFSGSRNMSESPEMVSFIFELTTFNP